MQKMEDLTEFDNNLTGLFSLSKTILKVNERRKLNLTSKKNPVLVRLEKYIRIYDRTEPEEHVWYFRKIYTNNHAAILRGPDRDSWITNNNITFTFGEETNRPINGSSVHLSVIYNIATRLREETLESSKGLPDMDKSPELNYADLVLLYLYGLFYEICDEEGERVKLANYISSLEEKTGTTLTTHRNSSRLRDERSGNSESGDGMEGLFNVATGLMDQMGIKLPKGQKMPDSKEFSSMLGNMMKNPKTKSMLGNMMKEMQECNNIGDVINKVVTNLGDGNIPEENDESDNNESSLALVSQNNDDFADDEFLD